VGGDRCGRDLRWHCVREAVSGDLLRDNCSRSGWEGRRQASGRAQQALRHTAHHQSCARLYPRFNIPSLPKPSLPTTEWCGVLGRRSASSATAAGTATPSRGLPPSPPATTAPSRRRYTASSGLSPPPSTSHGPTPPSRASAPSASPTTLASIVPLLLS
jgi:hypothetical protein